jgi:hypothetical protein
MAHRKQKNNEINACSYENNDPQVNQKCTRWLKIFKGSFIFSVIAIQSIYPGEIQFLCIIGVIDIQSIYLGGNKILFVSNDLCSFDS